MIRRKLLISVGLGSTLVVALAAALALIVLNGTFFGNSTLRTNFTVATLLLLARGMQPASQVSKSPFLMWQKKYQAIRPSLQMMLQVSFMATYPFM